MHRRRLDRQVVRTGFLF